MIWHSRAANIPPAPPAPPAPPTPPAPPAPPAAPVCRNANDPTGTFAVVSALGAGFAGFVSYGRNPDPLATAMMVGATFFVLLLGLFVLHVLYRLALGAAKIAIPLALLLLVGCALDWHWAEKTVRWLRVVGQQGVVAVERSWSALHD